MVRRRYQIDERTKTMSTTALLCRSIGHSLTLLPTPGPLRAQHRKNGERLVQLRCTRDCPYFRDVVVDLWSGETLRQNSGYFDGGKEYLVQVHGTGRLSKAASRAAFFAYDDKNT